MIYPTIIKRFFDLLFSLSFLVVVSPLILFLMILIRLKLGKSVFFRQERAGRHGRLFNIIKFRSMLTNCDADKNLLPDELRLTTFGQFLRHYSLDELPSLWNVLRGDMSLVGPRPLLVEYLEHYNDYQKSRHNVLPGITGWAQVNGRNAISWEHKFELDIWYVKHQSMFLDIKILCITFLRLIKPRDIHSEGHATMPRFMGTKSE
jgi:sugar transferase EpsL